MEDYFRIGVLTSTHGVKGEISIYPTTDDLERFQDLEECYLCINGSMKPVIVEGCKYKKGMPVLKFKEYNSIDEIQPLKNTELFVDRDHAIPLEEGEYYISDLIGLRVIDDDSAAELGELHDVMQTGANDVYVVQNGEREILIPVIDECIRKVDLEAGEVRVHLLPGLI